jgi:[ribosomal protein S18]-alanine N-acetyltransferase
MSCRLERVSRVAAVPLAMLHRTCFPEDPWDAAAIGKIIGMPGFFGLTGSAEAVAVGFVLALDLGAECEIVSLGVVPGRRRAGIGSALLDGVFLEARRRGAERVVLEVAVDNTAARTLYAARGLTVIARRRNYYRQAGGMVDALVLGGALSTAPLGS